jgi:hypothetical protein
MKQILSCFAIRRSRELVKNLSADRGRRAGFSGTASHPFAARLNRGSKRSRAAAASCALITFTTDGWDCRARQAKFLGW